MATHVSLKDGSRIPIRTLETVGPQLQSLGAENPRSLIYLVHKCGRTSMFYHDAKLETFLKSKSLVEQDGSIHPDIGRLVTTCIKIDRQQITIELPLCSNKTRT